MNRSNPLRCVYDIQNNQELTAQQKLNKHAFPLSIDIELTNHCNFTCRMCFTGSGELKRARGFMSDEIFEKVVQQAKKGGTKAIRFIGCGEPMLHKSFAQYLKLCKQQGFLIHITTNASLMDEEIMQILIDNHIDSLKYSFQGVDKESYEYMRRGGSYDKLLNTMKCFYRMRGDKELPFIAIATTVTDETERQIEDFKKNVAPFVDYCGIGITELKHIKTDITDRTEQLLKLKEKQSHERLHFKSCPEVFDKLNVLWDGSVTPCCNDYEGAMKIGNINDQALQVLWNCDRVVAYRKLLSEGRFDEIPLCKGCIDYMKLVQ